MDGDIIKKIINNQLQNMAETNENIKHVKSHILNFSRANKGYINLNAELIRGSITYVGKNYNGYLFLDNTTNLLYFFKRNSKSGGLSHNSNKEFYESLISKMISSLYNTTPYYPALCMEEKGTISPYWSNGNLKISTFHDYLVERRNQFSFHEYRCISDIVKDEKFLNTILSSELLQKIKYAPQQFVLGNLDFKANNIGVKISNADKDNEIIEDLFYFDFGYSLYSNIQNENSDDIKDCFNSKIWEFNSFIPIGMGGKKNFMHYDSINDLKDDFREYAQENKEFRLNIKKALNIKDSIIDDAFKEMKDEGFKIPPKTKSLTKKVIELSKETLNSAL